MDNPRPCFAQNRWWCSAWRQACSRSSRRSPRAISAATSRLSPPYSAAADGAGVQQRRIDIGKNATSSYCVAEVGDLGCAAIAGWGPWRLSLAQPRRFVVEHLPGDDHRGLSGFSLREPATAALLKIAPELGADNMKTRIHAV